MRRRYHGPPRDFAGRIQSLNPVRARTGASPRARSRHRTLSIVEFVTLMHDPQYRLAVAWQNVACNQPPHPGFFLGEGMSEPPKPHIVHRDTLGPAFKMLAASKTALWPPNHKMVPVSLGVDLVDLLDPAPAARIVGVSSNEPVDGRGDGNTAPDWEITGPLTVALRAERSGTGRGRIYTVEVGGTDAAGNMTVQTVVVSVPVRRPWQPVVKVWRRTETGEAPRRQGADDRESKTGSESAPASNAAPPPR